MSERQQHHEETRSLIRDRLRIIWNWIPDRYQDSFQPEAMDRHLLEGEEPQLVIRMAWYRDWMSLVVFGYFYLWVALTILATALLLLFAPNRWLALLPLGLLILAIVEAGREFIEYHQWRLVKTNIRIIITIPMEHSWPLVDNIEMGDKPKVLDVNWSPNPLWRTCQFFTGARDLYISLVGFKFEQGTARVQDALIIPDVMPEDVHQLKELVFSQNK